MAQQTKKVRHVQKHDVEANWLKATGFTPLAGEIVIYEEDELHSFKRVKIGDGKTNINDLPFTQNPVNYNSSNLLANISPNDVNFEYSTQSNGWKMHLSNPGGGSGTLYINESKLNDFLTYSDVFSMNPDGGPCTINIQKINADSEAGEFDFINPQLKTVWDYNALDGENYSGTWTITNGNIINNPYPAYGIKDTVYVGENIPTAVSGTTRNAFLELTDAKLSPGEEYELSLSYYCYSTLSEKMPGLDIVFPYYDVTLTECIMSHPETYSEKPGSYYYRMRTPMTARNTWINVTIRFTYVGSRGSALTIGFRNYSAGYGDYCLSNIVLKSPTNTLPDFTDTSWEYKGYYFPSTLNEDGILSTDRTQLTEGPGYYTLCINNNVTIANNPLSTYELSIEAKRRSISYQWQNYMTLMENDKFALMNDNTVLIEQPKVGGPWTGALEPHYTLQVSASRGDSWTNVSGIEMHTSILSSTKSTVIVEAVKNGLATEVVSIEFDENTNFSESVRSQVKYIPCALDTNDFDSINIILALSGDIDTEFYPTKNFLQGIRVYGHTTAKLEPDYPITRDYFGTITCGGIKPSKYYGTWDDSSLDWSDL